MPIAISSVPSKILPAAIWGRISPPDRPVCDRLCGGPTTKKLAVFLQCEVSLMADFVEKLVG
jgi:hypothetical protein